MSLSSFEVACPCTVCKGKKQSMVYVGPGNWVCPNSGYNFWNKTTRDRAKRKHAEYVRAPK